METYKVNQENVDKMFTELCRLQTMSLNGMNCHEAQLRYMAILGTLHTVKIKPNVPHYWSDGFCFFPMKDLIEYFHKNGWPYIKWIGDADCKDCFDTKLCEFYGTGNQEGMTTQEKYYKQSSEKMVNKLFIMKILESHVEKEIPMTMDRLKYLLLFAQAVGLPISYKFKVIKKGVIIAESDEDLVRIAEKLKDSHGELI